ncbi:MAG: ATP-dependent 6-phosphofructokinase [Planctomycetes bacterium]|nr:ATP-dependent 6-phosphofructokinase [Planctomycetota bacterium]
MASPRGEVPVESLGPCRFPSPLGLSTRRGDSVGNFVPEGTWVRHDIEVGPEGAGEEDLLFEKAGPRAHLFFDPARARVAIVTSGGLCPGLNNVIRSAFLSLHFNYGVPEVLGIRYGYRGLNPAHGHEPLRLEPDHVEGIDSEGGTLLGTSRALEEPAVMVDFLERRAIDILLCAGGDGTLRGAHAISTEVARRGARIAVVGIPKTIDNDVPYCDRSFGFATAMEMARAVLEGAHNEARSTLNGIGLVKVMGRDAGYIAAAATLASGDVNFTLIPEVPLILEGDGGFLRALEQRLAARGHAVIVVAEGVGRMLAAAGRGAGDTASGPGPDDVGVFLRERIRAHLKARGIPCDLKYIDPSYIIRSVPANAGDSVLCDQFARRAVHAAMAGRTDTMIGFAHADFMHVPLALVAATKKRIDPEDELWTSVLAATGQPRRFGGGPAESAPRDTKGRTYHE